MAASKFKFSSTGVAQVFMGSSMHEETISIDQETWDIKQGER
jgi:hypothetical protein